MSKYLLNLGILLVLMVPSNCQAVLVYGESAAAEMTGSRSAPGTLTITGDVDWNDGEISWEIINNLNGTFSYTYTFTNFNSPAISHFTLDISDDAVSDSNAVTNAKLNNVAIATGEIEFGNKDGITGAVKFDTGDDGNLEYSFTSNRSPVYGDFLLKGGSATTATNTGFGDQSLMATTAYIARPNGVAVPEPSAFLCLGLVATFAVYSSYVRQRCSMRISS